ncbi:LysR substrate-binding domain-containing protein [Rhizobium sullae]|uniref:LysR substrate binding domain-containing protein n=1 Tax=Rhizobium sullae TaxID=50338 RepID=A0A4R3QGK5_RHISU|nr:LysR substrate-binding domain-containing protein [Rhizobium sullae]TCU19977.1 LysR substrate binding domain-containing protein [Rhizobium sullae]
MQVLAHCPASGRLSNSSINQRYRTDDITSLRFVLFKSGNVYLRRRCFKGREQSRFDLRDIGLFSQAYRAGSSEGLKELGVSLFTRTMRRLHATEEGRLFHERCVFILREAESAYAEVSQHTPEPTGVLTLTAPLDYGSAVVAPIIAAYIAAYPQMRVDVVFDDDISDLVAERLDLPIRVGWLSDSSHRARRFGTFEQYFVATPSVAERIPDGLSPADAEVFPGSPTGPSRTPFTGRSPVTGRRP